MSQTTSRLSQFLGIVLLVFGVIFIVEGLLPLRSHAPNPSWAEIVIGVGLLVAGYFFRRMARSRL